MSETRDPDHALPAAYLLYKTRACDNENRPLNELWNERFREEFSKWGHLQSESEKTEWVYWADYLKTAASTNTLGDGLTKSKVMRPLLASLKPTKASPTNGKLMRPLLANLIPTMTLKS
ncbi:hypothetical protein H9Q70_006141 [Fusarium xylarioides]|nr:hypothetical protein H9Q70_006141 [Fusarium xylarioides]